MKIARDHNRLKALVRDATDAKYCPDSLRGDLIYKNVTGNVGRLARSAIWSAYVAFNLWGVYEFTYGALDESNWREKIAGLGLIAGVTLIPALCGNVLSHIPHAIMDKRLHKIREEAEEQRYRLAYGDMFG